jgi:hypothetical protein
MLHLILSNIKSLNILVKDSDRGRRTSDMFFLEDALMDHLEVKLAALESLTKLRLDYSTTALMSARKYKQDSLGLLGQSDINNDVATI